MSCCCNCRCSAPAPLSPVGTVAMTVMAKDVKEGDWLDTSDRAGGHRDPGLHRVFLDAEKEMCSGTLYHLHRERTTYLTMPGTENVKIWRPVENCNYDGVRHIDLRQDVPCRTLTDAFWLGKIGLAKTFPVGSVWEVGPFANRNPQVVRITGLPFTSGTNHSSRPEDIKAKGKPSWFLPTETLYTPLPQPFRGKGREGQPPVVLAALTPRMAAIAQLTGPDAPSPCSADRIAELEKQLQAEKRRADSLAGFANTLRADAKKAREDFEAVSRALYAIQRDASSAHTLARDYLRSTKLEAS